MNLSTIILLFYVLCLTACKQNHQTLVDKYYNYLNNYQSDNFQNLLTDDFKITLTYTDYFYNRTDFFDRYIRNYKVYKEKSTIVKTISDNEPKKFLVEDNSDYLQYLKVNRPKWIVTFVTANNKIQQVIIDTTETSRQYFNEIKEKSDRFTNWLKEKYPDETSTVLHETEGLFLKRLKEYVEAR